MPVFDGQLPGIELALRIGDVGLEIIKLQRDLPLLERWMRSPHVLRWWGAPDPYLAALQQQLRDTHAMITADGKPVGYICWQHPSREELEAAKLMDLPEGLVDIDILIGELDNLGCGVGPRALMLLLARLRSEGVAAAGVATSILNFAAIRAFEKAGFKIFRDFEEPDGLYRYMVAQL
jgi:aminoglycoside 6'-N-acetyltransferase